MYSRCYGTVKSEDTTQCNRVHVSIQCEYNDVSNEFMQMTLNRRTLYSLCLCVCSLFPVVQSQQCVVAEGMQFVVMRHAIKVASLTGLVLNWPVAVIESFPGELLMD